MTHPFDLVIRNGTIVDGTGAAPRDGDVAVKDGRIAAVGKVAGARPRGDRRQGPHRDAGLRRHPHALRRPGRLGPAHGAVVLAWRDDRRDGQLRRRLRALQAGRPREARRADGRRRGHSRPRHARGPEVDLGDVRRILPARSSASSATSTCARCCRTPPSASTSWATAPSGTRRRPRPTSPRCAGSRPTPCAPAPSASRPRAPSATRA